MFIETAGPVFLCLRCFYLIKDVHFFNRNRHFFKSNNAPRLVSEALALLKVKLSLEGQFQI